MTGRMGRRKGKVAEREVAAILTAYGFEARRDGRLADDLQHNIAGVHLEVKRREQLALPAWWRQTQRDAGDRIPVLLYRRSGEPWHAMMPAVYFVRDVLGWLDRDRHIGVVMNRVQGTATLLLAEYLASLAAARDAR